MKPHIYWNRTIGMHCCGALDGHGKFIKKCDPDRKKAYDKFMAYVKWLERKGVRWEVFPK